MEKKERFPFEVIDLKKNPTLKFNRDQLRELGVHYQKEYTNDQGYQCISGGGRDSASQLLFIQGNTQRAFLSRSGNLVCVPNEMFKNAWHIGDDELGIINEATGISIGSSARAQEYERDGCKPFASGSDLTFHHYGLLRSSNPDLELSPNVDEKLFGKGGGFENGYNSDFKIPNTELTSAELMEAARVYYMRNDNQYEMGWENELEKGNLTETEFQDKMNTRSQSIKEQVTKESNISWIDKIRQRVSLQVSALKQKFSSQQHDIIK